MKATQMIGYLLIEREWIGMAPYHRQARINQLLQS